jgi:hypothetical protein
LQLQARHFDDVVTVESGDTDEWQGSARLTWEPTRDHRLRVQGTWRDRETNESDGKANLHQRAIGAGISMETGKITRAVVKGTPITHHPDTGMNLIGFEIPGWQRMLELAARCGPAVGLGYCGADIMLDVNDGPLVIEVNAHPGIEIQNINREGLKARIAATGENFR